MNLLEKNVDCPYCGENLNVLIDDAEVGQSYVEDCQVCCRPINFNLTSSIDGDVTVSVSTDSE